MAVPIWKEWSAASPDRVRHLQDQGTLYQEILGAEQAYFRARVDRQTKGMDADQADEQAKHDDSVKNMQVTFERYGKIVFQDACSDGHWSFSPSELKALLKSVERKQGKVALHDDSKTGCYSYLLLEEELESDEFAVMA